MGHWSHSQTGCGHDYVKTRRECLSGIRVVLLFFTYLEGTNSTTRTDYDALNSKLNLVIVTEKLA